jgi:hypothetical protein
MDEAVFSGFAERLRTDRAFLNAFLADPMPTMTPPIDLR